jgi:hypothetical protein
LGVGSAVDRDGAGIWFGNVERRKQSGHAVRR